MKIRYSFKTAIAGLKTNKMRAVLTILGIVIGIAAIMLIMSIGKGAEGLILNELGGMGAETIVIRPGKEPTGPSDAAQALFSDSLKKRDVEALKNKNNVPHLVDIAPVIIVNGSVSYLGETYRPTIFGWSAEMLGRMLNTVPREGYFFTESDIKQQAPVAVIGSKVKDELFGDSDAVGENIKIKNKNFRVVGVMPKKGQATLFNIDESVVLPYTTAQTYLASVDYYHEIMIMAESPELVDRTVADVKTTLRNLHNITDPDKDDFNVVTQEGLINQIKNIIGVLTAFLSAVVAIALVVGGIGVMNIMLVAVTERTREIGLRKSIGATNKNIMLQFLLESVILTGVGGLIGVMVGATFSFLSAFVLSNVLGLAWTFSFSLQAIMLGVGVSAFVGLVFGLYPAYKASLKSPMEALRYE